VFLPYLGDYLHLMAVGQNFYGIFSANNTPNPANFPAGVTFQRNCDKTKHVLFDVDGKTPVDISIDPFFFQSHAVERVLRQRSRRRGKLPFPRRSASA